MNHILVTGGAGYIGSVAVRQLLARGYAVRAVDSLKWGGAPLFDVMQHERFEFQRGDLREADVRERAVRGVDGVVHLAAIVGDPACRKYADEARATNWDASVALFEAAERAGVDRFVFASTCSNYGKMAGDGFVDETSPLNPVSLYAELKVAFERYLLETKADSPVCATPLRYSTVYGFSPRIRFDLTVNEFTRNMVVHGKQEIWGEQFWRPYCHVDDLAGAALLVLESPREKVGGRVFGVGDTDENYQKGMIIREVERVAPGEVTYVAKDEDPRDYRVDFSRIRDELGFRITKRVPDGIREIRKVVGSGVITDTFAQAFRNI